MKPTLSLTEVAAELGRSVDWLRRHRVALARDHGFPLPLPGKPLRWSARAIAAWRDHDQLRRPAPAPANDQTDPALVDLTRRRVAELLDTPRR